LLPQRRFNSNEAASFVPGGAADSPDSQNNAAGDRGEQEESASVYVGNVFFSVGPQDLEKHMSRFGRIRSVRMLYDNKGLSKGFVTTNLSPPPSHH
jgi:RNA recognition motif-containing protein